MVKFCPSCGAEVKDDAKFCPECGNALSVKPTPNVEPVKKTQPKTSKTSSLGKDLTPEQRKSFKIVGIIGIIVIVVIILALAFGGSSNTSSDAGDGGTPTYTEPVLSEEEYKANCSSDITFKKLEKNSARFYGEKVKFSGEVVQIMESGGETDIRLAISGSYGSIIYVTYPDTVDVYEGDYITVWGEVLGDYSYTSTANYQITLPWISAKYIE